jgi:parallel beta-helix repeat protein
MTNSSFYIKGSTEVLRSVRTVKDNTVNGRPLIFLKDLDLKGKEVQEDAGCIFLVNVSNARITERSFNLTYIAITIIGSNRITVSDCEISNTKSSVVCKFSSDILIERMNISILEIGFQLTECRNSVIRNNDVHGGYWGFYLSGSDGNIIENNQFRDYGRTHGIVSNSDDNRITNNLIHGDLVFDYSFRNTIENNRILYGELHLSEEILWDHLQPEPRGNIVGNLSKEFYLHRSGDKLEIPEGTDWIVLFNISRCSISNIILEKGYGIEAQYCNDLMIVDTALISTPNGIQITNSIRTSVIDCELTGTDAEGIKVLSSESCRIEGNTIDGMSRSVEISGSNGVEIVENSILNSRDNGIVIFENSHDTMVLRNEINNSEDSGIRVRDSYENLISGNRIENCARYGVELRNGADRNMVYNNRFSYNHNSVEVFHDLRRQASDDGQDNSWYYDAPGVSIGNYWLDLQTPDENEDGMIDIQYQMDGYRMSYDLYPMVVDHEARHDKGSSDNSSELYISLFFIGIILWLGILVAYKIIRPTRE